MLSLVGASLKLRQGGDVDPMLREQVDRGLELALDLSVGDLDAADASRLMPSIEMAFAEAGELFRNPDRVGGWRVEDVNLLQTQGRVSGRAFGRILSLAEKRPLLRETLEGTFLDVGTGVGGIALEAARTCPRLRIEGIDVWRPALALAEGNVVAASRPASYLVAAIYSRPTDAFEAIVSYLRTLRSGGDVTDPSELEDMLRTRGYVDVETDPSPPATFVFGRLG